MKPEVANTILPVRVSHYFLGGGLSIVLALALFEPSSALGLNFLTRSVYFALIILPILGACIVATKFAIRIVSPRGRMIFVVLIACGITASTALTPYTLLLERWFNVQDADDVEVGASLLYELAHEAINVVPTATIVWLLLNQLVIWSPQLRTKPDGLKRPNENSDCKPNFDLSRFGLQELGQLIALEAQQHYLRVYTINGTHLVLCGINSAVNEFVARGLEGMLVHRSYWVNWQHVVQCESTDGQYRCVMTGGIAVPIARRRWAEVSQCFEVLKKRPQIK